MSSPFSRTITLQGFYSTLSLTIAIAETDALRANIESEPDLVLSARMKVSLSYEDGEHKILQEKVISVWSQELYELLALSLCFAHLAERKDTTEKLSDILKKTTHLPTIQWAMYQTFFGNEFLLFSKGTPRFIGQLAINILFFLDENDDTQVTMGFITASPDNVHQFSVDLRQIYEEIRELLFHD
jgi:hypothetical protein